MVADQRPLPKVFSQPHADLIARVAREEERSVRTGELVGRLPAARRLRCVAAALRHCCSTSPSGASQAGDAAGRADCLKAAYPIDKRPTRPKPTASTCRSTANHRWGNGSAVPFGTPSGPTCNKFDITIDRRRLPARRYARTVLLLGRHGQLQVARALGEHLWQRALVGHHHDETTSARSGHRSIVDRFCWRPTGPVSRH